MTQTPSGNKLLTGSGKRSAVIVTSKYSLTKTTDYVCIASIFTCIFPREKRPTSLPWHALYDGSPLLHPSNKSLRKCKKRRDSPVNADMDYFHSPSDVAPPLHRVSNDKNLVTVPQLALRASPEAFPTMSVSLPAAKYSKSKSNDAS
jgi:hypothetical protein